MPTSPSNPKSLDYEDYAKEATHVLYNSSMVAEIIFEETWRLAKQSNPNAPGGFGKEAARQQVTEKLFQYLTEIDGRISRLIKGRDA